MAGHRRAISLAEVERAVQRLRTEEREVLLLSAFEHLSTGAIAERLGITPQDAERLLARAICGLDQALEELQRPWWRAW